MKFLVPVVIAALAVSCRSEEPVDTDPPVLESIVINNEQEQVVVPSGTDLDIHISARDNEDLKQVKIDIHDAFDGHTHGKVNSDWTYVQILEASGTFDELEDHPSIPTDATAGLYHAVFRVLDQNGNEGEFVERELIIENGSQPVISLVSPELSASPSFRVSESIELDGTITDAEGIEEVHILLRQEEDHDHFHIIDEMELDLSANPPGSLDMQQSGLQLQIPSDAETGIYELVILAFDIEGNQAILSGDLEILP